VDYQVALVTPDFLTAGDWDQSVASAVLGADVDQLVEMQLRIANLTRLDNRECLQAYATTMYGTTWRNALVVTSLNSTNSSLINVYTHTAASTKPDINWACHGDIHQADIEDSYAEQYSTCDTKALLAAPSSWTIPKVPACPEGEQADLLYNIFDGSGDCNEPYNAPVRYCLAESFPPHCTVSISTALLATVIVFNAIKTVCLIATLRARNRPLANLGDAIASFMQRPDPETVGKGALEVGMVSSGLWRDLHKYTPVPWIQQKRRWWYAVPRPQLSFTFFVWV